MMFEGKRITRATFKSFVKKNEGNLFVRVGSRFDGMTDCVESVKDSFSAAEHSERNELHTLGIQGVWLVRGSGRSGDSFSSYDDGTYTGISVYNCCGSFVVAIPKEA